ncbi:transcriptional regulator [Nocardia seriolae]|uniref:Transcriptional regulator n=1 Tax=Nocardia seriolae TaxID=37332 RepID=A0ABC9YSD0_9NOCA|nr:TetR family transcriptional regulator [Nocardia seriolae]GEM24338.1 TetR family transcriptional regulator [Nocardia seriolae NBRC 15557]BAW09571.1 TetR family transcriptional regulator [Nocardia seriolae]BEK85546.1 TetR/AcrR family transcriptional regulator [Nocardia seriolae]BEK98627.1 TetR/AcrR family transcriptional regulator [Nocardia seriolae]
MTKERSVSRPETGAAGKRVRLSPAERRQQLITLGVEMLRDRDLEDISVTEIADRAGISRGLLFHYFSSTQDFQLAILREANAEFLERTAPDRSLDLYAMLHDSIDRYIDYVSENSSAYQALLRGPVSTRPEMAELVANARQATAERILAEAPIPADDPDQPRLALAVRGWIAFVEEVVLTWLREKPITREALVDMLVASLPALALSADLAAALQQ